MPGMEEVVTNPVRTDGFGCQFLEIICSALYAEMSHKKFLYSPFRDMEHNYDGVPDFIQKKEELINFIGNFDVNYDEQVQLTASHQKYKRFFYNNIAACAKSSTLKEIKDIFRLNKNREDYFDPHAFNIAIHIRRPNPHDAHAIGTQLPDRVYLRIIKALRIAFSLKNPLFHIYSQGDIEKFESSFHAEDFILHINEPLEHTFSSLVFADVLVTSTSTFSYTAGLISNGEVYYIPCWLPPLPHWETIY